MSAAFAHLTNEDLRSVLEERGLSKRGNKAQLLARIVENNIPAPVVTTSNPSRRKKAKITVINKSTNSQTWTLVEDSRTSRVVEEKFIRFRCSSRHVSVI
jgi:hypothetical protein